MATFDTYYFNFGTSWVVPAGVTAIQVECFGSTPGVTYPFPLSPQANYSGGSYSKSANIAVTAGSTVYFNIGASGGNTWFNTSNVAPTSSSSTSSACLAVGGNTVSAFQVAANCGDVKYAGGNGRVTTGNTITAQGGPAGPNGAGADVGDPYTNTGYSINGGGPFLFCQGGGANGGFQGSLGVPAYGRSGSGTAGMGSRNVNGTIINGTSDIIGNYKYRNNLIIDTYSAPTGLSWGLNGGNATYGTNGCCCVGQNWGLDPISGFVVITVIAATQKNIVYIVPNALTNATEQSFTLPADFASLISLEAFGSYGATNTSISNFGGTGGGAYAKTLGSSVTASMVAGSTTVYYLVGSQTSGSGNGQDSYIRIGTSGPPSSVTDGVLAKGSLAVTSTTGSSGGVTTNSVGNTKYAGGKGGNGGGTNNLGGGGGLAGPLGAGGNGGNGSATASTGDGGGGASNGGSAGGAGTSSAGGAGGGITGGTGGAGATALFPSVAGTNGGGGGGGFGVGSTFQGADGGRLNNSIYVITGAGGSNQGPGRPLYAPIPTNILYAFGYGLVVFTYVPITGSTVALTGSTSSAFGGTLTPSQAISQALSGASATALTGALTPSQTISQALSGAFASGQTSSFPINLTLNSSAAAAYIGTLGYVKTGWQPIDDMQIANWQNISNPQTASWVLVDDGQTSNWQNISNPQTADWVSVDNLEYAQWSQIDNTQSANWGDINDSQNAIWTTINDAQSAGWVLADNSESAGWSQIDDTQSANWNLIGQ